MYFKGDNMILINLVVGAVTVGTLSVAPSHVQPFLAVKPVIVQHFSQLSEPSDIQPALGFNVLGRTLDPQPTNNRQAQELQPAAYVGLYQLTFDPQQ